MHVSPEAMAGCNPPASSPGRVIERLLCSHEFDGSKDRNGSFAAARVAISERQQPASSRHRVPQPQHWAQVGETTAQVASNLPPNSG
jgi:hypothetical protein